jgi:hypothetical protein
MCADAAKTASDPAGKTGKTSSTIYFMICLAWLIASVAIATTSRAGHYHSFWRIVPPLVLCVLLSGSVFSTKTLLGKIEHVEIHSPDLIQKIRQRYQSESAQLAALGFDPLFYFGETISIFRLFLGFPALVLLHMWMKKVPMTLYEGTKILSGNPVFGAKDKTAYAHPNSIGITFHTALRDRSLLLTKNYSTTLRYPAEIRVQGQVGSLSSVWEMHKQSLQALASGLNPVDRQNGFQFYSEIVRKEIPVD